MLQIKDESILKRIEEDKKHFEKTIGGGEWSEEDVLKEWIKILDALKEEDTGDDDQEENESEEIDPKKKD